MSNIQNFTSTISQLKLYSIVTTSLGFPCNFEIDTTQNNTSQPGLVSPIFVANLSDSNLADMGAIASDALGNDGEITIGYILQDDQYQVIQSLSYDGTTVSV